MSLNMETFETPTIVQWFSVAEKYAFTLHLFQIEHPVVGNMVLNVTVTGETVASLMVKSVTAAVILFASVTVTRRTVGNECYGNGYNGR